MKFLTILLSISTAFAGTPLKVTAEIDEVYVPAGFDSNDNSEIILSGYLPNRCHKEPKVDVNVSNKQIFIKLTTLKYHQSNPFCPEVIVPFVKKVELGELKEGRYDVIINKGSVSEHYSFMNIKEAQTSNIDNFLYANVHSIKRSHEDNEIRLNGYNESDCLVLDDIKLISNYENTYSILPKMKKIQDFCPKKMTPFSYRVELPENLNSDDILLHIRSSDGESVNRIIHTY